MGGEWNGTVGEGKELRVDVRSYQAELGVLRGSHIGNLSDLEAALEREEPFFTTDTFSYAIAEPRQRVSHLVGSVAYVHEWNSTRRERWQLHTQHNVRKEFDVRRSGRSAVPALDLQLFTQEARYSQGWGKEGQENLLLGGSWRLKKNTNDAETGILPLIPNYLSHEGAAFVAGNWDLDRATLSWGLRYAGTQRAVAAISNTLPREVVFYTDQFHAWNGAWTYRRPWRERGAWTLEGQWNERAPEPNELYSFGLHQGVSGIEEGNPDLNKERGAHLQAKLEGRPRPWLRLEAVGYVQHYLNYIYLQPTNEFRLTIRGAFPVFEYRQAAAQLLGAEGAVSVQLPKGWWLHSQWNALRGTNLSEQLPLVYMPPSRITSVLRRPLPDWGPLERMTLAVEHAYTSEQRHWDASLDFAPPPPAYHLWHVEWNAQWHSAGRPPQLVIRINNATNTAYRDYLNRLRYFADDLGRNVQLGVRWNF